MDYLRPLGERVLRRVLPAVDAVEAPSVRLPVYAALVLGEATVPRQHLCHPKRQGTVPSPEPVVEYWPDRLDGCEAGGRAQKPLPPFRHQGLTELLAAQRDLLLHQPRAPCPLFLAPSI